MSTYIYAGAARLDDPSPEVCRGVRGTVAGYGRHKRAMERPCDRCREAMNAYNRKRRRQWEANQQTRQRDTQRRKARARAWAALARHHAEEFSALMRHELGRVLAEAPEAGR